MGDQNPAIPLSEVVSPPIQFFTVLLRRNSSGPFAEPMLGGLCNILGPWKWPGRL